MSRHTPGPWECNEGPYGGLWIVGSNNESIGVIEKEEDARLIAAAPDMLKALENTCRNALGVGLCMKESCINCRNRAAIAKAKGESHE
jgi:hypothetical protein